MEVKTTVGINVEVQSKGLLKIMTFDKPVRSIELTKDESAHIGSLLMLNAKTGITAELRKLLIEKFFSSPRSFRDVKNQLYKKGIEAKSASLNTILSKMVERQELIRIGSRGAYLYKKP